MGGPLFYAIVISAVYTIYGRWERQKTLYMVERNKCPCYERIENGSSQF